MEEEVDHDLDSEEVRDYARAHLRDYYRGIIAIASIRICIIFFLIVPVSGVEKVGFTTALIILATLSIYIVLESVLVVLRHKRAKFSLKFKDW
jgi:hypothetical protein